MRRSLMPLGIGFLAVIITMGVSTAQTVNSSAAKVSDTQYSVLNPWAEVDPIPLRGISPRLQTLAGKKIGLFANFKRASVPIAQSIERRLKAMYPDIQTSMFHSTDPNVTETETKRREEFIAWIKSVDGVIAEVGD